MENPWYALQEEPPYLLTGDRHSVFTHNQRANDLVIIQHHILPEPYLGRHDAPVILLNLNPGYADEDVAFYQQEYVRRLWRKNILHEAASYPFYLLDANLDPQVGGTKWWRGKLRALIESAGLEKVAQNICCIEFFPYHSRRYKPLPMILDSQKYSFHLVRLALNRGAVILVMRNEKVWLSAIPELAIYKHLYRLNSAQNVSVSRGNCPEGFPLIEQVVAR